MSEQKKSIYDGLPCLMAEQLGNKRVTLTVKRFEPCKIVGESGRTADGFEIEFNETPKLVRFACKESRRQLNGIFGTEDYSAYIGKRVCLYAKQTARGPGIRFAAAEGK